MVAAPPSIRERPQDRRCRRRAGSGLRRRPGAVPGRASRSWLFTGFGLLLYVLGWLLLPADGDEVSAGGSAARARAVLDPAGAGRRPGHRRPVMSIAGGIFCWGLPVAPLVIGGIITVMVLRKRAGWVAAPEPAQQMSGGPMPAPVRRSTQFGRTPAVGGRVVGQGGPEGRILGRPGRAVGGPPALVGRHPGRRSSPRPVRSGLAVREAGVLGRGHLDQRHQPGGGRTSPDQPEQGRPGRTGRTGGTDTAGLGSAGRRAVRLGSARADPAPPAPPARRPAASSAGSPWAPCCWSAAWPRSASSPAGGS